MLGHAVDDALGDLADAILQAAQLLRQEDALGQAAVAEVVGIIHLDQGADLVGRAAGQLAHPAVGLDRGQGRRAIAVVEQLVLAFDLLDVGVAGDRPEWIKALRLDLGQRRLAAQPGESRVDLAAIGVGPGVDDGLNDVRGDCHRRKPSDLWVRAR